ncbi:MAG: helix-turn-helix transcriptional regulator [Haloquadratum sp.]
MRVSALLGVLLLVVAVAPASVVVADARRPAQAGAGGATGAAVPPTASLSSTGIQPQVDGGAPRTAVVIRLRPDRSAHWRVAMHYRLETGNETRAFRQLAAQYESGEADIGPTKVLFASLQRRASEATGRPMAIENVTYHASVDAAENRGTLALTFRWTNFLRSGANETLVLGDVFALPTAEGDVGQTWLSIFDAGQQIVIHPPEGYTVTATSIPVQQREGAVVLMQPSDFEGDGRLEITYAPIGPAGQLPLGLLAWGGLAVVAALVAGVWLSQSRKEHKSLLSWLSSSDGESGGSTDGATQPTTGGGAAAGEESTVDDGPTADADASESGGPHPNGADGEGPAGPTDEPEVDLSLLSDEERVEHLLERNGGRMKQATIVDETGWSDAKVSQLLSEMADEGRVDKLRLGRENLISLPTEDDGRTVAGGEADTADDRDGR